MTTAQIIMLAIGLVALAGGSVLLLASRTGSPGQRYARRIVGAMVAALGLALTVFALGLAGRFEPAA